MVVWSGTLIFEQFEHSMLVLVLFAVFQGMDSGQAEIPDGRSFFS
jgi:hypothetical protein